MEILNRSAKLFKLLADPTRLSILTLLSEKEANVSTISAKLDVEQSAVSHQLRLLKDNHLVKSKRLGKSNVYSPDDLHIYQILEKVFEHAAEIENREGMDNDI